MILELNHDEAAEMFSDICIRELGLTGQEFLARWDAGQYRDVGLDDIPGLVDVWMVMGLVGR